MKLTEQHVSDEWINDMIFTIENTPGAKMYDILKALLELKQRRAEDRQRDEDNAKA
jgi:hypothetical protein